MLIYIDMNMVRAGGSIIFRMVLRRIQRITKPRERYSWSIMKAWWIYMVSETWRSWNSLSRVGWRRACQTGPWPHQMDWEYCCGSESFYKKNKGGTWNQGDERRVREEDGVFEIRNEVFLTTRVIPGSDWIHFRQRIYGTPAVKR